MDNAHIGVQLELPYSYQESVQTRKENQSQGRNNSQLRMAIIGKGVNGQQSNRVIRTLT